ncbi:hypothetical protein [Pseudomonas fluorescens]|uniref:hypothetical protein n=1 Tax=Pseudomonas fluorescens TaxID=294 RepID=UPI0017828983|nr:hypothetical protein [Pseudomonas fluorescens]
MAARTPTGAPRGRAKGCAKTGGRVKSSIDRQQRQLVSAELAYSILATFEMLGGTAAMVEWAADNKTVFYTQILSRLMPAPQKDEADVVNNTQINVSTMNDREAAVRVAFALSKAVYDSEPVADITQREAYPPPRWQPPPETPPLIQPEPVEDPAKTLWVQELPLTAEQRRDNALVRDTKEATLANYHGAGAEQGLAQEHKAASSKRSAGELARSIARNRRELL